MATSLVRLSYSSASVTPTTAPPPMTERRSRRRAGAAVLSCLALTFVVAATASLRRRRTGTIEVPPSSSLRRSLSSSIADGFRAGGAGGLGEEDEGEPRPIMHTFFAAFEGSQRHTGMSQTADLELLGSWEAAWHAAGWKPVVITLEDAKRHPLYDSLNRMLDGGPFGEYDRLCFLRWLAMAQVGGGWMADYDLFPLNPFVEDGLDGNLPNGGALTVYDKTPLGAVPCLVSGTAQEWERMAREIVENAADHKGEDFWSDMLALRDLHSNLPDHATEKRFYRRGDVLGGSAALIGGPWNSDTCRVTWGKRAIHFSHHDMIHGKLPEGAGVNDRPKVALWTFNQFRRECGYTAIFHTGDPGDDEDRR